MKLTLNSYSVYHLPLQFTEADMKAARRNPAPMLAGILNFFVQQHPKQILVESSGSLGVTFEQLATLDIDALPNRASMKGLRRYFDLALLEMRDEAQKARPDPQAGYLNTPCGALERDQVLEIIEAFPNLLGEHLPRFRKPQPVEVAAKEKGLQSAWVLKSGGQASSQNQQESRHFPMFGDPGWQPGPAS